MTDEEIEQLCEQKLPAIERAVYHWYWSGHRYASPPDVIQGCMERLLRAAKRYDETRGVHFESFTWDRLDHWIVDELRACRPLGYRRRGGASLPAFVPIENETEDREEGEGIKHQFYYQPDERQMFLRVAFSRLSDQSQRLLQSHVEGKSTKEIAQEHGRTSDWAWRYLQLAKEELDDALGVLR